MMTSLKFEKQNDYVEEDVERMEQHVLKGYIAYTKKCINEYP